MKSERTEVHGISLEVLAELVVVERDDTYVASIAAGVSVVGDTGSPVEIADDSLVSVAPGGAKELEEVIEDTNVLLGLLQLDYLPPHVPLVVRLFVLILRLIRQQRLKLFSELPGVTESGSKQRTSLVDDLLEATNTAVTDVLLGCARASAELVVGLGVLGHDVFVGRRHDPLALLALPVLPLVEEDADGALRVIVRQRLRSDGDAQEGRQSSADVVSRIGVRGDAHHGRRTSERLDSSLDPVDGCVVDAVLGEDGKDGVVGEAAGSLRSGVGMDRYPDYDMVIEDVLAVLTDVGETHGQHRRDVNSATLLLEKLDDLGSDRSLPKRVLEDRVVGGLGGLERDDRVPLFRDDVRTLLEVGTLEEVRRVVGDAVVEVDALKGRDGVITGRGGL